MNINLVKFNPTFQKKLVAKANVLKSEEPIPVSIYQLDKKEDKDYYKNLFANDKNWKISFFLKDFSKQFEKSTRLRLLKGMKPVFYTVEDKNQNCLGLVEIDDAKRHKQNIVYLETFSPDSLQEKRSYKYIGETILSFLVKQKQIKSPKKEIYVEHTLFSAKPFYVKSFFDFIAEYGKVDGMYLSPEKENLLLENNKKHTKSEIELVG